MQLKRLHDLYPRQRAGMFPSILEKAVQRDFPFQKHTRSISSDLSFAGQSGSAGWLVDNAVEPLLPARNDTACSAVSRGPSLRGGVAAQRDVPHRLQPDILVVHYSFLKYNSFKYFNVFSCKKRLWC
jgi:hypothetical protein